MPTENSAMSNSERLSAYTAERDRLMELSKHESWRQREELDINHSPPYSVLVRPLLPAILVVGLVSGLAGVVLTRVSTSQSDARWATVDTRVGDLERQISLASIQLNESRENERRLKTLIEVMLRSSNITEDQRASLVNLYPPGPALEPPPAPSPKFR